MPAQDHDFSEGKKSLKWHSPKTVSIYTQYKHNLIQLISVLAKAKFPSFSV
jgi:hypothetical protein